MVSISVSYNFKAVYCSLIGIYTSLSHVKHRFEFHVASLEIFICNWTFDYFLNHQSGAGHIPCTRLLSKCLRKTFFFVIGTRYYPSKNDNKNSVLWNFYLDEFLPWISSRSSILNQKPFLFSSSCFSHINNCILSGATKRLLEFTSLYAIKNFVITF